MMPLDPDQMEKHVFLSHSHITYMLATSVIAAKGIAPEDVLILLDRGYSIPIENSFKAVQFPYNYKNNPFKLRRNFIKARMVLSDFDKYISNLVDNCGFHIYLPHSHSIVWQVLASHPLCKSFSYIEEGTLSFLSIDLITLPQIENKYLLRALYKFRIKPVSTAFHNNYNKAYYVTEKAFPDLLRKEKIPLSFKYDLQAYTRLNGSHIIVFDPSSNVGLTTRLAYNYGIISTLHHLINNGVTTVYYKLHPEHYTENSEYAVYYKELFSIYEKSFGLTIVELEKDISLELISLSAQSVSYYISISSIGHYAFLNNQTIYTFAHRIASIDKKYIKAMKLMEYIIEKFHVI